MRGWDARMPGDRQEEARRSPEGARRSQEAAGRSRAAERHSSGAARHTLGAGTKGEEEAARMWSWWPERQACTAECEGGQVGRSGGGQKRLRDLLETFSDFRLATEEASPYATRFHSMSIACRDARHIRPPGK